MSSEIYKKLRGMLNFKEETAAIGFCNADDYESPNAFYLIHLDTFTNKTDYTVRERAFNSLAPSVLVNSVNNFVNGSYGIFVEIHTHPFQEKARFSTVDDEGFPSLREDILKRKPGSGYMRIVLGTAEDGFYCEYFSAKGKKITIDDLIVFDSISFKKISRRNKKDLKIDPFLKRNAEAIGRNAQLTLKNIKVGLVGTGGLGNNFLHFAVRYGFRNFILCDEDRVEPHNLNRLLGNNKTGNFKVDALKKDILKVNADIELKILKSEFSECMSEFIDADILIGAVDDDSTRYLMSIFAFKYLIPYFDMGTGVFKNDDDTVTEKGGQIRASIADSEGLCLVCLGLNTENLISSNHRKNREAAGYVTGGLSHGESPGSVITFNAAVSATCVAMLADYLTVGLRRPVNFLSYDELSYTMRPLKLISGKNCTICQAKGEGKQLNKPEK